MARPIVSNLMVNPFAPVPKAVQTPMVSTGNIYDPLVSRAMAIANEDDIQAAIQNLRQRLQGQQYTQ